MRIARFTSDETPRYGILDEEAQELVVLRSDPIYDGLDTTGERVPLDSVRLLSPVIPRSKVIGIGRNYAEHAAELGNEVPEIPLVFLKPNTAVIGPDDPIVLPKWSTHISYEAELAVVISRLCKQVPVASVDKVIFGYTVANDVTARDRAKEEPQWVRAKAFDTSCPLGPYLNLDLDPADLAVQCRVDGEVRQDGRTSQMIRSVAELVSYVSEIFTLLPGDVILTGTPAGVGELQAGQSVECEVEGIGVLRNPVVRR